MKVKDVMLSKDKFPMVNSTEFLKVALDRMSDFRLGIVCVVDEDIFMGIITDGDIRRKLLNVQKPFSAFFTDFKNRSRPKVFQPRIGLCIIFSV